ncbi:hypothetical protein Patl1_31681 [Pistacia atlantica]|uniref:Uncharacterized protein n=1 Tax=Pistacia atlantica TaxID=434234 RepID=A0ACC1ANH4_9ROSI|nr:hypothetical protein Patl1_31681 [Pistacia atlantica]
MLPLKQETNEEKEDSETPDPLIPPPDLTIQKRIEWFRGKVPELDVLKSDDSGQKFHGRVLEFFDKNFTPDVPFVVKNTPAEAWLEELKSGNKDPGKFPLYNNLSNLIRLAILYRYGGVYLDTDFIVMRNFTGLRNAVGVQVIDRKTQNWSSVNNALMIFDIAHPILVEFLTEFATTFDGNIWGHNGPNMLSRVIQRLNVGDTAPYNITILPIKAFYLAGWLQIPELYKKPTTEQESKRVEDTVAELNRESYALHLWNRLTRDLVIEEGSVIQRTIASRCFICRDTYNSSITI